MELDGTRQAAVDSYASAVPLNFGHFDLISMSQAHVHMWSKCGKITSNSYKDTVFTLFIGSLSAVTLTFNFLIPKAQMWPKRGELSSLVFEICCSQMFWVSACCDLDLCLTIWPQNLISTYMSPFTSVTKIGWNSLQWFLFIRFSGCADSCTQLSYSVTDRLKYSTPLAPFFNILY